MWELLWPSWPSTTIRNNIHRKDNTNKQNQNTKDDSSSYTEVNESNLSENITNEDDAVGEPIDLSNVVKNLLISDCPKNVSPDID